MGSSKSCSLSVHQPSTSLVSRPFMYGREGCMGTKLTRHWVRLQPFTVSYNTKRVFICVVCVLTLIYSQSDVCLLMHICFHCGMEEGMERWGNDPPDSASNYLPSLIPKGEPAQRKQQNSWRRKVTSLIPAVGWSWVEGMGKRRKGEREERRRGTKGGRRGREREGGGRMAVHIYK